MMAAVIQAATLVPWGTLIEKMPEIIDGASRLLQATGITRKKIAADLDIVVAGSNQVDPNKLKETVDSLEASLLTLNKQVSEAALLIKELAETNKSLVAAGQLHRKWLFGLGAATTLSLLLSIIALWP